jgi:hypothetical protein
VARAVVARAVVGQVVAIAGAIVALVTADGCGSTSDGGVHDAGGGASSSGPCAPGDTRPCVGPARCPGGQLCDDKSHWGICDCGATNPLRDGGQGSGGSSGTTGTTGKPIGRACRVDADCGGNKVFCLSSASNATGLGGPANGLCVVDCATDATACTSVDPLSVCVSFSSAGGPAYCLEGCTVGPSGGTAKCHDRPDFACDDSTGPGGGDGICVPVCRGDFDCGGRKCDLGSGFCNDAPAVSGTLPLGSDCDPSAVTTTCAGVCVPLDSSGKAGMCSGLCSLGTVGCGDDPSSTAPLHAECLFDATALGLGSTGDIGLCGVLCDCDSECTASGRVCRPVPAADQGVSGRAGYCGGAVDPTGAPNDHIAACPPPR